MLGKQLVFFFFFKSGIWLDHIWIVHYWKKRISDYKVIGYSLVVLSLGSVLYISEELCCVTTKTEKHPLGGLLQQSADNKMQSAGNRSCSAYEIC